MSLGPERIDRIAHDEAVALERWGADHNDMRPSTNSGHAGPAVEPQDPMAGPVEQNGIGADPGELEGSDGFDLSSHPRPMPWHQRLDGDGGAPHDSSLARAWLSCSTL